MKNAFSFLLFFSAFCLFTSCATSNANRNQTKNKQIDQGYGTVDEGKNTTSISQVDVDETGAVTWIELLQRTAGVSVSGRGNNLDIQIRASKSMTASHQPLFVLDGKPLGNGFQFISFVDPNMVKRISILKDAASASSYGSRGADGVILVTLK